MNPTRPIRQAKNHPNKAGAWKLPADRLDGGADIGHSLAIICSDQPRNGKTLFARLLTDFLALSNPDGFRIFDTDYPDGDLAGLYPGQARIVDFSKTAGQIQIFDTILSEPGYDYVIDLDHALLDRFFTLFNDISFDTGAAEARISVSVYFLLDRKTSTVDAALKVSRLIGNAQFIPVRNEAMGNILSIPLAARTYGDISKAREIILPRLSIDALNFLDQPGVSFAEFVAKNGEIAPPEIRFEIWNFLESLYNQRQTGEAGGPVTI